MSKRLAAVFAHPDDDTFGVAGTVALHAEDPDLRFVLIHATSGEAGMISDPSLATRETIGFVADTSAVAQRIVDALREHRTQASDFEERLSDDDWLDAASRANGVIAWPPWEPGDPVMHDAFEDLD